MVIDDTQTQVVEEEEIEALCENCLFFQRGEMIPNLAHQLDDNEPELIPSPIGICRRYPPAVNQDSYESGPAGISFVWPQVAVDAWCGEYTDELMDDGLDELAEDALFGV